MCGVRTHAHYRGAELKSAAFDHSANMTFMLAWPNLADLMFSCVFILGNVLRDKVSQGQGLLSYDSLLNFQIIS